MPEKMPEAPRKTLEDMTSDEMELSLVKDHGQQVPENWKNLDEEEQRDVLRAVMNQGTIPETTPPVKDADQIDELMDDLGKKANEKLE